MKYVRNIFKRTRMLIEYLILLDDYRSRLLNWGHLFDRVSWFWLGFFFFFRNLGKGKAGLNHLMMSFSIQQILSCLLLSAWKWKAFWQLQKVPDDRQTLACFSWFNLFVLGIKFKFRHLGNADVTTKFYRNVGLCKLDHLPGKRLLKIK